MKVFYTVIFAVVISTGIWASLIYTLKIRNETLKVALSTSVFLVVVVCINRIRK